MFLIALFVAIVATLAASATSEAGDTPHDPILIASDTEFNTTNGVVSGAGTMANPYIISGWIIDASSSTGIEIRNTNKHFTITDVTIVGETDDPGYSIRLYRVTNGKLDGIMDQRKNGTARVDGSDGTTVNDYVQTRGATVGFSLVRSDYSTLTGVKIASELALSTSTGSTIRDCIAPTIHMAGMYRSTLSNCTDAGSQETYGLQVSYSDNAEIIDCTFWNNTQADVYIESGENVQMRGCRLGARGVKLNTEGYHKLDLTNTVNGSTLRYYLNRTGVSFDSDAGQVIIIGCSDVRFSNVTMRTPYIPVILRGSENVSMDGLDLAGFLLCFDIKDCRNVTVSNATVQVDEATTGWFVMPMEIRETPGMRFVDCRVKEGFNYALEYIHSSDQTPREPGLTLVNCTVEAFYYGVYFFGGSEWDLTVDGCAFYGMKYAIYAEQHGRVAVTHSLFQSCSDFGVFIRNEDYIWSDANEISNCTFNKNWLPINLGTTDNVLVADNLLVNSTYAAISIYEGEQVVVRNNTVRRVRVGVGSYTPKGIILRGQYLTVERNTVSDCDVGISMEYLSDSLVRLNLVRECDWGLSVGNGCTGLQVIHNIFEFNNYHNWSGLYGGKQAKASYTATLISNGTEGNFWGDYTWWYSTAQPLNDRVWDTPYEFYGGKCVDPYPLIVRPDWFPPVAVAGDDLAVPQGTNVSLDGSASTDDVGIVRYEWDLVQGDWRLNTTGPWFNVTLDDPGNVTATLRVWDLWGNMGSDTITITVLDIYPPVAEAGPDVSVAIGERIDLDGSASSDNVGIVGFEWTVDPGGMDLILNGSTVFITIDVPGVFQVVLRVTDARGLEARDGLTITVMDVIPPVARAGPDVEVDQGTSVVLDGSGSTDDVGIVYWGWYFLYDGSMVQLDGMNASFVFDLAGEYLVTLEVRDKAGHSQSDNLTVIVRDTEPPVAVVGQDLVVHEGTEVVLDGRGSSDNVRIISYTWTFTHRDMPILLDGPRQTFRFWEVGEHRVTLEVADAAGNLDEATFKVTVMDSTDPTAEAQVPSEVDQGTEVVLDGSPSQDNIGVTGGQWDFTVAGEPVLRLELVTRYTFDIPGDYELMLTVRDAVGNTGVATFHLRVRDTEPPMCVAGHDITVFVGARVHLDGGNSTDNVGVVDFEWSVTGGEGTEHLTGQEVEHLFDTVGLYEMELVVTDAAGNSGRGTFNVTVLPTKVTWRLGPFVDGKGRPVEGVSVVIVVGGATYNGTTDSLGWIDLDLIWVNLVGTVEVSASKAGWKDTRFTLGLNEDRNPVGDVPAMAKEEREESTPSVGAVIALSVLVTLALVDLQRRRVG